MTDCDYYDIYSFSLFSPVGILIGNVIFDIFSRNYKLEHSNEYPYQPLLLAPLFFTWHLGFPFQLLFSYHLLSFYSKTSYLSAILTLFSPPLLQHHVKQPRGICSDEFHKTALGNYKLKNWETKMLIRKL